MVINFMSFHYPNNFFVQCRGGNAKPMLHGNVLHKLHIHYIVHMVLMFENARVYGDAQVYGNARVFGDAWVTGNSRVYGNAMVFGYAQMSGNALVYGNAHVSGNALVSGDAWVS